MAVRLTIADDAAQATAAPAAPLLEVDDLRVRFTIKRGAIVQAVNGVSFAIAPGETVALVGESGSGKSTTGLAIMGLVPRERDAVYGAVRLVGKDGVRRDVLSLPEPQLRKLRGNDVAMIFQEPMSSLNPVYSVGAQIGEALRLHRGMGRAAAHDAALELAAALGIANPVKYLTSFPHQLSGGMRQRAMIAMALAGQPRLLIADEPTTALDVTIQAQILELLKRLQLQTGMAMLFITHNLGVVAEIADRALVMYAGRVVESGPVGEMFRHPRMPYTAALLRSLPRLGQVRAPGERLPAIPGNVPSPLALPEGCAFHPRCRHAVPGRCDAQLPPLEACGPLHAARCLRWREIDAP